MVAVMSASLTFSVFPSCAGRVPRPSRVRSRVLPSAIPLIVTIHRAERANTSVVKRYVHAV